MPALQHWKALVVALVLLAAAPAGTTTIVLQPSSQDAFIQQDRPNRIAGASPRNTRIRVMASTLTPRIRRGLVQFDLAPIPTGSSVNSAIVELNEANNPGVPLTHGLHRIGAPWLQSAVKWNNQPPHQAIASAIAAVGTSTGFKSFNMTVDVQNAVNVCITDHGWMVKDQAETGSNEEVNYIAKEEDRIPDLPNRPKLTVDFTAPPCTTTADCADTNPCTTSERCEGGLCVVDPVNCDDGDPCTDDICDCGQGCINAPICNDGFSCTIDTCDPETLACTNTPVDSVCLADGCATGFCVADPDRTDLDPATGCFVTSTSPDGTPCTADSDQCTDDECLAGQCTHPLSPNGTPCNDGDVCTIDDGCQAGMCVGDPMTCGDGVVQASCGEQCDVGPGGGGDCTAQCQFICGPTPVPGCKKPSVSGKAFLLLKDKSPDKKDKLVWKWIKGEATTLADFGTPLTTTGYTLCLYDQSTTAQPLLRALAPAAGTCAGKPCWKTIKTGLKYKDKDLDPDGVLQIGLKAGGTGTSKVIFKGKGVNLLMPTLPLTPKVTVQLRNDAGVCWEAEYSAPIKNLSDQFKAKAD